MNLLHGYKGGATLLWRYFRKTVANGAPCIKNDSPYKCRHESVKIPYNKEQHEFVIYLKIQSCAISVQISVGIIDRWRKYQSQNRQRPNMPQLRLYISLKFVLLFFFIWQSTVDLEQLNKFQIMSRFCYIHALWIVCQTFNVHI